MIKRFSLSFRKGSSPIPDIPSPDVPDTPDTPTSVWPTDWNPVVGGSYPSDNLDDLSIYLYSPLLGTESIRLKCERTGGTPSDRRWVSDEIPWNGSLEVLDYSGFGHLSPSDTERFMVRYFVEQQDVVSGGRPLSSEEVDGASQGGYSQIDDDTKSSDWVWCIKAVWAYENNSDFLTLNLGCIEATPEEMRFPCCEYLFGTYKVVSYYWEGCSIDDSHPEGKYVPNGNYYPGITSTITSFEVLPLPKFN